MFSGNCPRYPTWMFMPHHTLVCRIKTCKASKVTQCGLMIALVGDILWPWSETRLSKKWLQQLHYGKKCIAHLALEWETIQCKAWQKTSDSFIFSLSTGVSINWCLKKSSDPRSDFGVRTWFELLLVIFPLLRCSHCANISKSVLSSYVSILGYF